MRDTYAHTACTDDRAAFRGTVRKVFAEYMEPFLDDHENERIVGGKPWKVPGDTRMLCATVAEEHGGLRLAFESNCVVAEELASMGSSAGFTLQNDITVNYFERLGY